MQNALEVLVTLPLTPELIVKLQGVSPRIRLTHSPATSSNDIPAETWARCEVLLTARVLPTLEQAPKLNWIQSYFAGVDSMLDTPIFNKPDIKISTMSGAAASQMAEYVVMMMLALGHRLPDITESQRKKEWPRDRWTRFAPIELRGATVGIIGYGSIGRQVARLLQTFGAIVLANKRDAMSTEDKGYTTEGLGDPEGDLVHRIYPMQALHSMLKECDYVVITAPLTSKTHGMINTQVLSSVKPTAFIIDVSRGGILDHGALVEALQTGKIAGAALDVFPEEPLAADSPLWAMPNVTITPHISGNSPHYDERAVALFSENLQRYIGGLPLYNLFDRKIGY